MKTSTQIIASAIHNFHEAYRDVFIPFNYAEDGYIDTANHINNGDCGLLTIALESHLKANDVNYEVMTNGSHWFIHDIDTGLFHDAFIINGNELWHITEFEDISVCTSYPKHLEVRWRIKLNYIKPVLDVYLMDGDIDNLPCNLINSEVLAKNRVTDFIPGAKTSTNKWDISNSLAWALKQVPSPILGLMEIKSRTTNTKDDFYKLSIGCVLAESSIQITASTKPIKTAGFCVETTAKKVFEWLSQNTRASLFRSPNASISRIMSTGIAEAFFGGLAANAKDIVMTNTAAGVNITFRYYGMWVNIRMSHLAALMGLVELGNKKTELSELYNYNKEILCDAINRNLIKAMGEIPEPSKGDFFHTWVSEETYTGNRKEVN